MMIHADQSCLMVVDVQERLLPVMAAPVAVTGNAGILVRAARRLGVPILVTEQNPRGLGPTVAALRSLADDSEVVEKMHFSCLGDDGVARRWRELGRPQTVVAGIEAHVCVLQTALDLLVAGSRVFVVGDATSSRSPDNHRAALDRLRADGAEIVSTEMVVFEWLVRAGTPEFRELTALIK